MDVSVTTDGVGIQVQDADAARPKRKKKRRRRRKKKKVRARVAPAPKAAPAPAPPPAPAPVAPPTRGPTRIDFDDRLVRGQTNKSGAVVLFSRKATGLESMVNGRPSFRRRTLRTVFDR